MHVFRNVVKETAVRFRDEKRACPVRRLHRVPGTWRTAAGAPLPDLPAFRKHRGKVCVLELRRQPAATVYYLRKQDAYLSNNPFSENKAVSAQDRGADCQRGAITLMQSECGVNSSEMKGRDQHPAAGKYCAGSSSCPVRVMCLQSRSVAAGSARSNFLE